MELLSARPRKTASVLSLIFLALPSFTCAGDCDYTCNGNTAGGICTLESSGARVQHCTSTNDHISAVRIGDGGCVSNQKAKQLRTSSVDEAQGNQESDTKAPDTSRLQLSDTRTPSLSESTPCHSNNHGLAADYSDTPTFPVRKQCIWDQPLHLPFGLCCTIGTDQQIRYGTCLELGGASAHRQPTSHTATVGVVVAMVAGGYCCLPSSVFLGVDGVRG